MIGRSGTDKPSCRELGPRRRSESTKQSTVPSPAFLEPPPFTQASCEGGFVTADDDTEVEHGYLFWEPINSPFGSSRGSYITPTLYFATGEDVEAAEAKVLPAVAASPRNQSMVPRARSDSAPTPAQGLGAPAISEEIVAALPKGPVEQALDATTAQQRRGEWAEKAKVLNAKIYELQRLCLSTEPRQRKAIKRQVQQYEDELQQVRKHLDTTSQFLDVLSQSSAEECIRSIMAEAQSADAYSTDDATQADELEMEVVARLAKEGQATIPSFIEDAAFWVGLGQHAGFLLACLRARDFNEEKAVLVAQNFARFRAKMKWSNVLLAAMVEGALRQNVFWLLPQKDRTGRAVLIFNMRYMDLRLCSLMEYQQAGAYLMQTAIASRQTQVLTTGRSLRQLMVISLRDTMDSYLICRREE